MSHAVTITRTTTTTSGTTSALIVNTGYLKTVPGLLKLAELILGAVCCFLVGWNFWSYIHVLGNPLLFFLIVASAFLIGTFCLLVSCLFSLSTGGIISRTIYELIYHSVAFIFYLVASILLLLRVKDTGYSRDNSNFNFIASILGFILTILYFVSAFYARRSYRGI